MTRRDMRGVPFKDLAPAEKAGAIGIAVVGLVVVVVVLSVAAKLVGLVLGWAWS